MNENDCLFEIHTVFNRDTYRALVQLMLRKLRRWPRIMLLTLGFGTLFLAGYRILTVDTFDVVSILFLILGNVLILFSVFAEHFLIRMLCAQTGVQTPLLNRYYFFSADWEVRSGNADPERLSYERITRILEYQHYLFLFLDGKNAYILDLGSIKKGTEKGLRAFLEKVITRSPR